MNTGYILFTKLGNTPLLLLPFWLFKLLAAVIAAATAFIFCRRRINVIKHEKDDLERLLLERTELLSYSKRDEQKAREQADSAERNKRLLLTKISHEIRTPMNGIMGMAALLNETPLNGEQKEYADTILHSGDNLLALINDILMNDVMEFSKNESGKHLDPKEFDLLTCIEEVLDVFALKAARTGIDLVCRIDYNVPGKIVADPLRLRQILMNLVENAIRFTTRGEIFIGVGIAERKEDDCIKLEFEVRDKGIGIPPARLSLLLKDLLQPDPSLNNAGAAGIGLIICAKLVRLMGGSISVESSENVETTFRFTAWVKKGAEQVNTHVEMAGLEGKKVLITDDNITLANLLKNQLECWNLAASAVHSGKKTLEMLANASNADLLLVDLEMPEMDGIELAQSVKRLYPSVPMVLLNKTGDERFRKYPGLFISVLNKPVRRHILSEQVFTGLRHKAGDYSNEQILHRTLSVDFAKKYPFNILVAEDNSVNQLLITTVLRKLGYDPHMANNGQEALDKVSQSIYDLILMDVQMPVTNGLEATRMIRLCLSAQPVIIAMTANALQGDREECLTAGMDDYIDKPVKLEDLVNMLEKWACRLTQNDDSYTKIN